MRSTVTVALGAAVFVLGIVLVAHEVSTGQDVWRRHSSLGVLVLGGLLVFAGLSEKANGESRQRLWPQFAVLGVLAAVGLVLYLIAPVLLILYGIVVVPFGLANKVWWL